MTQRYPRQSRGTVQQAMVRREVRYPRHPLTLGDQRALRSLAARAGRYSLYQRVNEQERKRTKMQWIKDAIAGLLSNQAVRLAFYGLLAAILAYIGDALHVAKAIP